MKKRTLDSILEIALKTFPVVLLNGAIQVGKSTLALENFKNYLKSSQIFHYKTNDKKEIDFIIEINNEILAIEIKQSSSVKKDDFKHIIDLQNKIDKKCLGVVFYNGDIVVEFSDDLVAIPFGVFL